LDEPREVGGGVWLIDSIDHESIHASGEATKDSAKLLFRSTEDRLDDTKKCESGDLDDPEIIISLALTSPTKLTSISVIGGPNGSAPTSVRLFANSDLGSFNAVHEVEPTQTVELAEDFCGVIQYPLRVTKFSQVQTLTLHFPADQPVTLHWIGLKGIASGAKRQAVVTVYESRPNLSDHKIPDSLTGNRFDVT
jgi:PITH domain